MSISDVYRDRYYAPGFVYIAGSASARVLKIGTTQNIGQQQQILRSKKYGDIKDWVLLYHVHVDAGGKIEHDARRYLKKWRVLLSYEKDGRLQKGREAVKCDFSVALNALSRCLSDGQISSAWRSPRSDEFEFDARSIEAQHNYKPIPDVAFDTKFLKKIEELDLSVRSYNCLKNCGVSYLGDLVQKTEAQLLRTPNFGRKLVNETKEILAKLDLHLGISICGWPPPTEEAILRYSGTRFLQTISEFELSVRTATGLKSEDIVFIGDLVQKTEAQILRVPNFGRKSLNEIKELLAKIGLHLGMDVEDWKRGQ